MIPKEQCYIKKGEFGTSYTLGEAKKATEQKMDEYHRHLMSWLIYEVERLEKENKELEADLECANGCFY